MRTHGKIKEGISIVKEQRVEENLKEHNAAVRSAKGYKGDIKWEHNGKECSTSQGGGAFDGHGNKRSFRNRHTGSQSAFGVFSKLTKKPLTLVHYQVSRIVPMDLRLTTNSLANFIPSNPALAAHVQ